MVLMKLSWVCGGSQGLKLVALRPGFIRRNGLGFWIELGCEKD